jgi:hypothetical protein
MATTNDLAHGKFTAEIAGNLKFDGFKVYYDHDIANDNVGKIVSAISEKIGRGDELSQLDIAIVEEESNNAIVLVEIEETNDRPKTFLGDIFGILFGNYVSFKGKKLNIGRFTTLILAGVSKIDHDIRNEYIQEKVKDIRISTLNAGIGNVLVKTYKSSDELLAQFPSLLGQLVRRKL